MGKEHAHASCMRIVHSRAASLEREQERADEGYRCGPVPIVNASIVRSLIVRIHETVGSPQVEDAVEEHYLAKSATRNKILAF